MIDAWKEETYPTAWAYMQACAQAVYDPGYIVNPWGRYRRFSRVRRDEERPDLERQAQNFPVQSTVADTTMIAMDLIDRYRSKHNMKFRMVNQIHDAIMLEAPKCEIEQCKQMFVDTMGSIDIPIGTPSNILRLGVDVKVFDRWGIESQD